MFIGFIAIAVELAVMAFGAMVVLGCCRLCLKKYFCCKENRPDLAKAEYENDPARNAEFKEHKKHKSCICFLKFIGFFTMVLSFVALILTVITFACFMKTIKELENDRTHNVPMEQYRHDLDKLRIYTSNNFRLGE